MNELSRRRRFLASFGGAAALLGGRGALAEPDAAPQSAGGVTLPNYARVQDYRTLKQSTYDRTGGNEDFRKIAPGGTLEVFQASGPGVITHVWFTIATESANHLKELVLRVYWEGNPKPSVEAPVGDFFGLNLGQYFVYQSAFLNCSSIKALNCYFAMPFRRSARYYGDERGEITC